MKFKDSNVLKDKSNNVKILLIFYEQNSDNRINFDGE